VESLKICIFDPDIPINLICDKMQIIKSNTKYDDISKIFDYIKSFGSIGYNMLINVIFTHFPDKMSIALKMQSHGIKEKFRWVWILNDDDFNVVKLGNDWFTDINTCYKTGLMHEPSFDMVRISPACFLGVESVCFKCEYNGNCHNCHNTEN
jgi:hypothetical protein